MNQISISRGSYLTGFGSSRVQTSPNLIPTPAGFEGLEKRQFQTIQRAFARHGGIAGGDDIAMRMRRSSEQPISTLARWIVERKIMSFDWCGQTLIPLFQFDPNDMSLRADALKVIEELATAFDNWELAVWFAHPNAWLCDAAPVDVLATDPACVLQVARADRFVARG